MSHDDVYSILEDRKGSLWVATYGGGLDELTAKDGVARFTHYRHDPKDPHSLSSDLVQALYEDGEGTLWIGTWGGGLNKLDPDRRRFRRYEEGRGVSSNTIWTIIEDRECRLWVGTWGGGLNLLDLRTGSYKTYRYDPADPRSLSHDQVTSIYEDREGLLWIGEVLTLVAGDALAKRISMRISLAEGLPRVSGDRIQLEQVILNLVLNSFEAMSRAEDGPRELTVRTWSEERESVEVALGDSGPPVSEEVFEKMFLRFFTTKPGGLGIGLSISRSIVEAHGGRLWAERSPVRGLSMRLSLRAHASNVGVLEKKTGASQSVGPFTQT